MPFDPCPSRQRTFREKHGRYLTKRERACVGKVQHSEASARREAQRLLALGEERINYYPCRQCHRWHVGRLKRPDTMPRTYDHTIPADMQDRPLSAPIGEFFSTRRAMEQLLQPIEPEPLLDKLARLITLDWHGGEQ